MPFSEDIKLQVKHRSAFKCCFCKTFGIDIHHIIQESEGGPNTIDNAAPLCQNCHDTYGDNPRKKKLIREARDWWYKQCEKDNNNSSFDLGQLSKIEKKLDDIEKTVQPIQDTQSEISELKAMLKNISDNLIANVAPAIKTIKHSSLLTAELDTPIRYVLFRVFLKNNYSISALKDFRVFIEFSNFNAYYDLSISEVIVLVENGSKATAFNFVNKAGEPDNFHNRPYQMSERGPAKELQFFSWNLFDVLHEKPHLRLKDLHMGIVKVYIPKFHHEKILFFDIFCNGWRISHLQTNNYEPVSSNDLVVDVPNKKDYLMFQFDNGMGMKQDFKFINLFDGSPEKIR